MNEPALGASLAAPLLDAVEMFTQLKIPYALIGGLAAMVYGRARFTEDIDFVAASAHEAVLAKQGRTRALQPDDRAEEQQQGREQQQQRQGERQIERALGGGIVTGRGIAAQPGAAVLPAGVAAGRSLPAFGARHGLQPVPAVVFRDEFDVQAVARLDLTPSRA